MTSKERVLKAINHEEADRVPVHLGFHHTVVEGLKRELSLAGLELVKGRSCPAQAVIGAQGACWGSLMTQQHLLLRCLVVSRSWILNLCQRQSLWSTTPGSAWTGHQINVGHQRGEAQNRSGIRASGLVKGTASLKTQRWEG